MRFSVWSKQSQLALGVSLLASVGAARADVVVSPSASLHSAPLGPAPPQPPAQAGAPPSDSPQKPVSPAVSPPGLPTAPGVSATPGLPAGPGFPAGPVAEPTLPGDTVLDRPVLVPVPGDKPVLVLHAPATNTQAIVYLHGLCGNVRAVESWKEAA
ncbi:MAG TPA: hypothetical protein VFQ61_03755, partial [Polyangiaceae bacterium]|nr:hypothetical protein [Polyangiaceae bacterium]